MAEHTSAITEPVSGGLAIGNPGGVSTISWITATAIVVADMVLRMQPSTSNGSG